MNNELTPHIKYHPNGNVRLKGQHNSVGQREGLWECFYENGNILTRTPYKEGKIDGIAEHFWPNGNIRWRTPYVGGKLDGIAEVFYPNGKIRRRTPYRDGEKDGIAEDFFKNGNINFRAPYKEGKKGGIQTFYDEQGYITKTRVWKDGELIELSTPTAYPNPHQMTHPKKWYIPVTQENCEELNRWRRTKAEGRGWSDLKEGRILLSEHPTDSSYYWCGGLEYFTTRYPSYQEISLEQFRQITNSQPMKHPEYWCIEATEENFKELYAWWRNNVHERYTHFRVGYTLMYDRPDDESKYYAGSVAECLFEYPQFVEITLEQFRQITNSNQTIMSKPIQISRELLNEYYNAATLEQRAYLTEHFKLDGSTTVEAIRGLHDMACEGWKPKIKKNHPGCFPEDSKYFDFSKHVDKFGQEKRVVPEDVCESLGLAGDFIQVRNNSSNPETHHRSFYLSNQYNWELKFEGGAMVLIPTKK
jgi:antitoxin component YwqK of YwqJK toxin-antitoxin module